MELSLLRYLQNNTDVCFILSFLCIFYIFKIWASKFHKYRKLQMGYLEFWKPNIQMVGLQWKNETLLSWFKAKKDPFWIKLLLTGLKKHPVYLTSTNSHEVFNSINIRDWNYPSFIVFKFIMEAFYKIDNIDIVLGCNT